MEALPAIFRSAQKQELLLRILILGLIYVIAFSTRLYSVLRYESVIHEFDPYFNFRSTQYLVNEGFYNFLNWFDEGSWYPLGRIVGGTVYPGLMITAAAVYWTLNFFNITINIRNVCVLLAPWFASNTAMVTYFLAKEVKNTGTGLLAAALIAIVPGYVSRSVAGSYDNEGIAIFTLLLTYAMWVKSVKTGSLLWSGLATLAYFYMVSAWGGYIFIINLIPLYVFVLLVSGRYSSRLYIAYCTFYTLGTLLSMQITFVGFQAVQSSEHMAAFGMFGLLQIYAFLNWVKSHLSKESYDRFFNVGIVSLLAFFVVSFTAATATGYISPWTGRFYTLLDPTYAKENIPIIASVSEHQPTTWASFFFDLHVLVILFPAGLYFCFRDIKELTDVQDDNRTDAKIFIICYGITSVYFAGVMVRLMLVLAPVTCVVGAIALSSTLETYMKPFKAKKNVKGETNYPLQGEVSLAVVGAIAMILVFYTFHCSWVTSEAYSSPSIVLAAKQNDGSRIIFDDFREAYRWLDMNTAPNARVMSWWDYGYQISAMANRTILVDNNTWNNSHIAQVGKAMSATEDNAIKIMRSLHVDYILVLFGGLTGYASDDINKFLWMVRIAGSTDPTIKEDQYFTNGEFRIDAGGSPVMLNSLMYKMCFWRFGDLYTEHNKPTGWDRVRNVEIGNKDFTLEHIEEVYTTQHWLVRIYKVKDVPNRGA